MTTTTSVHVSFEGYGEAPEIWGSMQANFLVTQHGHHAQETAVLLNDPAAAYLAEILGQPDNDEFRRQAARHVGQLWLEKLVDEGVHLAPAVTISRGALEADAAFVERVKQLTGK
ncbi:MAG: hypothetical protein IT302_16140 [Dehalococcoidia bacterium]|nr:hypothetical protein [Dehalococcoidia bacterium]